MSEESTPEVVTQEIVVAAPSLPAAVTPMEMLSRALDRGADLTVLEKLMELQERYEKNVARKAFDEAMSFAKAEIPTIKKNRHVGFEAKGGGARTDYNHEDLAEIARVITPILSKFGLSYRFRTHFAPNEPVSVTCIISHKLGYSEENTLPGPPDNSGNKNSIQAVGSTVTYLQRYTLKAALGLAASNDDDGVAAGGVNNEPITDDQLTALRALADKAHADLEKFCAYMRVDALPEIKQRDFDRACQALVAKAGAKKSGAK